MKTYSQRAQLAKGRNEQNGIKCLFPTRELHILKCWEKGNWNSSKCRVWGEYLDKHVLWQETVRASLCIDTGNEIYTSRKVGKHTHSFNKDNVPGVISAMGVHTHTHRNLCPWQTSIINHRTCVPSQNPSSQFASALKTTSTNKSQGAP